MQAPAPAGAQPLPAPAARSLTNQIANQVASMGAAAQQHPNFPLCTVTPQKAWAEGRARALCTAAFIERPYPTEEKKCAVVDEIGTRLKVRFDAEQYSALCTRVREAFESDRSNFAARVRNSCMANLPAADRQNLEKRQELATKLLDNNSLPRLIDVAPPLLLKHPTDGLKKLLCDVIVAWSLGRHMANVDRPAPAPINGRRALDIALPANYSYHEQVEKFKRARNTV